MYWIQKFCQASRKKNTYQIENWASIRFYIIFIFISSYMNIIGCLLETHLFGFFLGGGQVKWIFTMYTLVSSFIWSSLQVFCPLLASQLVGVWPNKKSNRSDRSAEHGSKQDVCWWQLRRMTYVSLLLLRKASYSAFVNQKFFVRREKWVRQGAGMAQQAATWLKGEERCAYDSELLERRRRIRQGGQR